MPSRSVSSFPYKVILLGKKCGRFFYLSVFLTFFFFCSGKSETLIDISHFLRRKPLMEDDSSQIAQKDKWPTFHFYFKRSWDHVLYYSLKNWRESSWEKWLRYFSGTIIRWRQKKPRSYFFQQRAAAAVLYKQSFQNKCSNQFPVFVSGAIECTMYFIANIAFLISVPLFVKPYRIETFSRCCATAIFLLTNQHSTSHHFMNQSEK